MQRCIGSWNKYNSKIKRQVNKAWQIRALYESSTPRPQALLTWSLILVLSHILQAIFQFRGQLSDIS